MQLLQKNFLLSWRLLEVDFSLFIFAHKSNEEIEFYFFFFFGDDRRKNIQKKIRLTHTRSNSHCRCRALSLDGRYGIDYQINFFKFILMIVEIFFCPKKEPKKIFFWLFGKNTCDLRVVRCLTETCVRKSTRIYIYFLFLMRLRDCFPFNFWSSKREVPNNKAKYWMNL